MARTSRKADRRLLLAAWTGLATLLASGCAAMPSDGPPQPVNLPQNAGAENLQVRVFPVEPHPGASAGDVLTGFLTASNADEADFGTALKYLTEDARKHWNPGAGVVVLDHSTSGRVHTTDPTDSETEEDYSVSGNQVARLDEKHTYRDSVPAVGYSQQFTLVKETEGRDKGEWRIAKLPDGLIIDLTNFKNGYRQVHRYFYAAPESSGPDQGRPLVPDPIYVRRRIDPLTAAAQALVAGPSDWLGPAVETAFHGVQLVGPVTVSDSQTASAKVSIADFTTRPDLCTRMANQLYFTLADQQPKRQLDRLALAGARGGCTVDSAQAQKFAPGLLAGSAAANPYYLLDDGQLMQPQDADGGRAVPGPLGRPSAPQPAPAALAVRRDGQAAAVVSADRSRLAVTALDRDAKPGTPVVTSRDAGSTGHGLSTPSWDGRQNLWVVDRDPAARRVLMVRDRTVVPVTVNGLNGRSPVELRISSDGTRLALLTQDSSGAPSLQLGLVVRTGPADDPQVTVTGLRPLAGQLTEILSFSWADADQLLVLGKERDKLQQLHYVGTDGSQSADASQPGGDSMVSVSATEATGGSDTPPAVLGTASKQIYRLVGGQWQELTTQGQGRLFTYPG